MVGKVYIAMEAATEPKSIVMPPKRSQNLHIILELV
jgi:hypothetical protein